MLLLSESNSNIMKISEAFATCRLNTKIQGQADRQAWIYVKGGSMLTSLDCYINPHKLNAQRRRWYRVQTRTKRMTFSKIFASFFSYFFIFESSSYF